MLSGKSSLALLISSRPRLSCFRRALPAFELTPASILSKITMCGLLSDISCRISKFVRCSIRTLGQIGERILCQIVEKSRSASGSSSTSKTNSSLLMFSMVTSSRESKDKYKWGVWCTTIDDTLKTYISPQHAHLDRTKKKSVVKSGRCVI